MVTRLVRSGHDLVRIRPQRGGFALMHTSESGVDLGKVAALWPRGNVVRSWLLELTAGASERPSGR